MEQTIILQLIFLTFVFSVPFTFAGMGGMLSERAGIRGFGVEGMLLLGALSGHLIYNYTGFSGVGLLGGALVTVVFAVILGFIIIELKSNSLIAGIGFNILIYALSLDLFPKKGNFSLTSSFLSSRPLRLPAEAATQTPHFAQSDVVTYVMILLSIGIVFFLFWLFYNTVFGIRFRAAQENPKVLETVGISTKKYNWYVFLIGALLVGLGGAYLSIVIEKGFSPSLIFGKGFIALVAIQLGRWKVFAILYYCLLFALIESLQVMLYEVAIPSIGTIPQPILNGVLLFVALVFLLFTNREKDAPISLKNAL